MKTCFVRSQFLVKTLVISGLLAVSQISHAQDQTPPDATTDTTAPAAVMPSDIDPASPLAQVIKLAQSGVEDSVILAYINGSGSPFSLTPDQIIYLKDLGLPSDAITAMIQRDGQLGAAAPQSVPTLSSTAPTDPSQPAQPVDVTQNYFYDTLSPYGNWVNVDGYGLCWQPTVVVYNSSWQPYGDHGHWVNTDSGWYWLSDYSWGSTAFHYGRWFRDSRRGWCWWPDTTWAPSWVTWRNTGANDYCGWAPLPPFSTYRPGVGFYYRGVAVTADFNFGLGANAFCFVPTKNFYDPHPFKYRAPQGQITQIYQRTTIINNYNVGGGGRNIMNVGIAPSRISTVTHAPIRQVTIRESSAPVDRSSQLNRDTLTVHRPVIQQNNATTLNRGFQPTVVRQNPSPRTTVNTTAIINNHDYHQNTTVSSPQNSNARYLSPRQQDFSNKVPNNTRPPVPESTAPQRDQQSGSTYRSEPAKNTPAPSKSAPASNSNGNQNNKSGH